MTFEELQQIVESNSRAIQAMLDNQAEDRLEREELRAAILRLEQTAVRHDQLLVRLSELNEGVVSMLARQDETQPTILAKLNSIERKVDRLLEPPPGNQDSI